MESSILFESVDKSVVVVDIPRSIEEAQELYPGLDGVSSQRRRRRRLISAAPIEKPWDTPEPRNVDQDSGNGFSATAVAELMTLGAVRAALNAARAEYAGPWCLPRELGPREEADADADADADGAGVPVSEGGGHCDAKPRKKRKLAPESGGHEDTSPSRASPGSVNTATTTTTSENNPPPPPPFIPPGSRHLQTSISAGRSAFLRDAPAFELIVLDPPWPSRSARRKRRGTGAYGTARDMDAMRALLRGIPIDARLGPGGLVAVWVTNKPAVSDLLLGGGGEEGACGDRRRRGLFAEWGLEPVAEWIWLKITAGGQPVVDLEARWRKPWERLLIARRKGPGTAEPTRRQQQQQQQQQLARTKVILAVPDVHSRKPNLRGLFAEALLLPGATAAGQGGGGGGDTYVGLEVFARNLTAGWWAWGDEALCFQQQRHWVVSGEDGGDSVAPLPPPPAP